MTKPTHVLVPREPTEEMIAQGEANNFGGDDSFNDWASDNAYRAMLTASPNEGQVSRGTVAELEIVLETMGSCTGMTNKMLVEMLLKHLGLQIKGEN